MAQDFEWDEAKAASNLAKHGISFDEVIHVFDDPGHVLYETAREVDREDRFKAVGLIGASFFTGRGGARRIISGRRANRNEERRYADHSLQDCP